MISSIIIAKNQEKVIVSCIKQLAWTQEVIVVDNGSTDDTARLAKKHGARVVAIAEKDFSKLRNAGADAAKGEWLLYIDTDEEVPEGLVQEIQQIVSSFEPKSRPHAYTIQRINFYLNHLWPSLDGMIRLIYKPSLKRWFGALHETADIDGNVGVLEHQLIHNTHKTLEEMVEKTNEWSGIEAEFRFNAHHPEIVPWRLFRVMLTGFFDSFITQGGWKAKTVGLIESIYQAFSMFITYAKLWEMQQKNSKS